MKKISIFLISAFIAMLLPLTHAAAATLTVGEESGDTDQTLSIEITVDDPTGISGAAFSLEYSSSLTVSVASTFFDTFVNQFTACGLDPDQIAAIEIPVGYSQPLITNEVAGPPNHMKISAARCEPAAGDASHVLFTLDVSLKAGQPAGDYSLAITPTTLNNTDAGYAGAGETIDLLIGSSPPSLVFPVILDDDGYAANVVDGSATFTEPFVDTDGDGMDDDWEEDNFGDLSHDGTGDTDRDGYSDKDEHDNDTDPNDPVTMDPPGGPGYDPLTDIRVTNLDIDGDGNVDALSDGILIIRYLFGFQGGGPTWIDGAVSAGATRTTAAEIETYIASVLVMLDIDGDGNADALSDGILIVRYLFGFQGGGPTWIDGAVSAGATRTAAAAIEAYIAYYIP